MNQTFELSIVIPAYQAGSFIDKTIRNKIQVLESLKKTYEMIVVLDGPDKQTYEKLERFNDQNIRIFQLKSNHGKGYAVRYGFSKAKGKYIGYVDADDDIDPKVIADMYNMIKTAKTDAAIGSKIHPKSNVNYPFFRKIYSNFFSIFIRILFKLKVSDTQTGAKLYSRKYLDEVLPECRLNRFAFEIEMLSIGFKKGFTLVHVPVQVNSKTKSSIKFLDGIRVIYDIFMLYFRR